MLLFFYVFSCGTFYITAQCKRVSARGLDDAILYSFSLRIVCICLYLFSVCPDVFYAMFAPSLFSLRVQVPFALHKVSQNYFYEAACIYYGISGNIADYFCPDSAGSLSISLSCFAWMYFMVIIFRLCSMRFTKDSSCLKGLSFPCFGITSCSR